MKSYVVFASLYLLIPNVFLASVRYYKNSNLTINGNQLTLITGDSSVSFFALGDWGGTGLPLLTKSPSELASAYRLGKMASSLNSHFQIGLGDNFYYYGVKTVNDGKFKEIFEEVYSDSSLKNTPWFHTMGNHDYYGNAQAQIDYTAKSNRWILPDYNYSVDIMTKSGQKNLIKLFMIDTIKLCGNTYFTLNPFDKRDSNTPSYASTNDKNLADQYFANLDSQLSKASTSGVPYIIVAGHFPVYSIAEHGSTKCLVDRLAPLLHKYKVSAYLSGHDHNLQHISVNSLNTTVEYMVSGANSLNKASSANANSVPSGSFKYIWPASLDLINGGFLMIQATESSMTIKLVKSTGDTLYQKVISPRN